MMPESQHLHDEQFFRAAFLYRTPATASSQCPPCPTTPSPRRQSLHRSSASADGRYMSSNLQRHNSTPARRRPTTELQVSPLTPHEQVLRARLERVLISGRVVDEKERRRKDREDSISSSWPWFEHCGLASTPPKSISSSDHGHPTYSRSRSRTDPHATFHRPVIPTSSFSSKHSSTPGLTQQLNIHSWTLSTADTSPALSEPLYHMLPGDDLDAVDSRLLTPPPTPPLYSSLSATTTLAVAACESATVTPRSISTLDSCSVPNPSYQRRAAEDSVERLDLTLHKTFNARKASERCRTMEGYVSFAQVEGLGLPPNGVDDDDDTNDRQGRAEEEEKRGRVMKIGTWARKWFVGVQTHVWS